MIMDITDDKTGELIARYDTKDFARIGRRGKSLYAKMKNGTLKLLQEFDSEETAKSYYRRLKNVLQVFSPNYRPIATGIENFMEKIQYEGKK